MRRKIDYIITDVHFPYDLEIYRSANAWWKDRRKVEKLIEAFKSGHTVKAACAYAGISKDNYVYFCEIHPAFEEVKDACKELPMVRFMNTINSYGVDDLPTARWYLSRRHPDFASHKAVPPKATEKVRRDGVLQPTANVDPSVKIDPKVEAKMQRILKAASEKFMAERNLKIQDEHATTKNKNDLDVKPANSYLKEAMMLMDAVQVPKQKVEETNSQWPPEEVRLYNEKRRALNESAKQAFKKKG